MAEKTEKTERRDSKPRRSRKKGIRRYSRID